MAYIIRRPSWYISENHATPEAIYRDRRNFLKGIGLGGLALAGIACAEPAPLGTPPGGALPGFERNPAYAQAGRPLSDRELVLRYNNFYELALSKNGPARAGANFKLDPYTLEIGGLVDKPLKLDIDTIEKLGLEERTYRFRCVEAWAMTVPWVGVPLHKVLALAGVRPEARFVRLVSFEDSFLMQGLVNPGYPWPYHEGLRLDEAMNDLTLVATGLYGERLYPQSGTPLRIVVPWKYGYKGPKSVVRIELVAREPGTFWNSMNPSEYKFYSNVDPKVSHPRWSQARERYLGEQLKLHETQWYNGYGEQVAKMYEGMSRVLY